MNQNFDIAILLEGPRWRWWSLAIGIVLVGTTAILAVILSAILDERASVLLLLGLLAELLVLSFMGSGMLKGTSRRMSRGGLQRETAMLDTDFGTEEKPEADKIRDRERNDRRTIRSGLMALPVFLTVLYLLFQ